MVTRGIFWLACSLVFVLALVDSSEAAGQHPTLSYGFYDGVCSTPLVLRTIREAVQEAISSEKRIGASLLRLHFHDCFANGCDGSILLDPAPGVDSEKVNVRPNSSLRQVAFDIIDQIKSKLDAACGASVVSCADILTVAARDSVALLGGPSWQVPLGRRDSTTASSQVARDSLPTPIMELPDLIQRFKNQGLNERDLVALSGGHTIGLGSCNAFRGRIYNATNIDPAFAKERRSTCPFTGGDANTSPFDDTPLQFDGKYFNDLVNFKGLLLTDQALYNGSGNGSSTDGFVRLYSSNYGVFALDFVRSMIKMGNIKPLTGNQGQIRLDCKKVN